jgi:DUF4097 and DUF4098 domain-containing protein YvlB
MGSVTTTDPPHDTGTGVNMPTFETSQPIVVSIEMSRGVAHLIATDRTDAVVSVNPSDRNQPDDVDAAEKIVVDLVNGTLSIRGPKPRGIVGHVVGWKGKGSVDVTVELPEGSSLRADVAILDLRCDGRLDDVDVKTGVGDVRLDRTGAVRVRTSAGQVSVEQATGTAEIVAAGDLTVGAAAADADVRNLNGRTWLGHMEGTVKVKSANGDVAIEDAGGDVTVKTANGNIRIGQVARGSTSLATAAGGLQIGIKEGTAAWIDVVTKFGRVRNDLDAVEGPETSTDTLDVRARTSFGDVVIARSPVSNRQGGI